MDNWSDAITIYPPEKNFPFFLLNPFLTQSHTIPPWDSIPQLDSIPPGAPSLMQNWKGKQILGLPFITYTTGISFCCFLYLEIFEKRLYHIPILL